MPNPGLGFAKSAVRTQILYLPWLESCSTHRTHGSEVRININGLCSARQPKLQINYCTYIINYLYYQRSFSTCAQPTANPLTQCSECYKPSTRHVRTGTGTGDTQMQTGPWHVPVPVFRGGAASVAGSEEAN